MNITMQLQKIKWAALRLLVLMFIIFLPVFTLGLSNLIFAPITSKVFFNDYRFWRYYKYMFLITLQTYHIIFKLLRDKTYRQSYNNLKLTCEPASSPEGITAEISPKWTGTDKTSCHGCIKCCVQVKCPLLKRKPLGCLAYNSFYWRYFSCGRFPVTEEQINYFGCEKWIIPQKTTCTT